MKGQSSPSRSVRRIIAIVGLISLLAVGCSSSTDDESGETVDSATLNEIQDRGVLRCGLHDDKEGFSVEQADGTFKGIEVDYCSAIAAAVLGDASAYEAVLTTVEERFNILEAGDIDVLIRSATATAEREGELDLTFATPYFYDGAGFLVKSDSGFTSVKSLNGQPICVAEATTTANAVESTFATLGLRFELVATETAEEQLQKLQDGECVGVAGDRSRLASDRLNWPKDQGGPDAVTVFSQTLSKEPLAAVTRSDDERWSKIVNWTFENLFNAEELGVKRQNAASLRTSVDTNVRNLLGTSEEGGPYNPGLGLEPNWVLKMIEAVGNYGEIYDRHLGPDTKIDLERGINNLWTNNGLLYGLPY